MLEPNLCRKCKRKGDRIYDTVVTLAKYLGVSCDFLLIGENDPSVKEREAKALLPYKEIIDSYKNATIKSRNLARAALDLPPEK